MRPQDRSTLDDHLDHQARVRELLQGVVHDLVGRIVWHDDEKNREPEFSEFAAVNEKLASVEYDSDEYWTLMERLRGGALEHHYETYRHHPEHFENGIEDMTLVDLLEMVADWKAAGERHDDDEDIHDSIEKNRERFGLSDQLVQILSNTADEHLS